MTDVTVSQDFDVSISGDVSIAADYFLENVKVLQTGPQGPTGGSEVIIARSYIAGLTLSTAGSSPIFSVAAGTASDKNNLDMMTLGGINKTTSPFGEGSGGGGLDTAVLSNNTWYHVHLIKRPDTQVVDVAFSSSANAPLTGDYVPAAYTLSRRIGSMKTNASGQWISFNQQGDEFLWATKIQDANTLAFTGAAQALTLSVPTGVQVWAISAYYLTMISGSQYVLVSSFDQADAAPSASLFDFGAVVGISTTYGTPTRTNTSAQVRVRGAITTSNLFVTTSGWIDRRGKDA
jgi:hypothetical protein